ncbi:MAG: YggS family pyridoxal phosphate-dependent enzyme [Oscillospiraceae bacterium]
MMEKSSAENRVRDNLRRIRIEVAEAAVQAGREPGDVQVMAVTKTVPPELVNIAIEEGIVLLGENRAQELNSKFDDYQKDGVSIHFIGDLQTNKVRQIIDKVNMIQSLDSHRLAKEIEKQAGNRNLIMDVLIEVNIGDESTKSGVPASKAVDFAQELSQYPHIRLRGFMTIPPICDDIGHLEGYFSQMQQLSVDTALIIRDNDTIDTLSMGMSGDFALAIKHGATIVRIGTALFGGR